MSVPSDPIGALLDAAARAPQVGIEDLLAPPGGLLVIAPHPDDETLGCGAAIMAALSSGRPVAIAVLTDGEMSHPRSVRHPADALARLRREEFARAVAALAAGASAQAPAVRHLHLPDAGVPSSGPVAGRTAAALVELAEGVEAATIWCTWRGDPHCDHAAAAELADRVEAMLGTTRTVVRRDYAVWGRFGDAGAALESGRLLAFPPDRFVAAKRAAIGEYASQMTGLIDDDPDGFVMPARLAEHFADCPELFIDECRP